MEEQIQFKKIIDEFDKVENYERPYLLTRTLARFRETKKSKSISAWKFTFLTLVSSVSLTLIMFFMFTIVSVNESEEQSASETEIAHQDNEINIPKIDANKNFDQGTSNKLSATSHLQGIFRKLIQQKDLGRKYFENWKREDFEDNSRGFYHWKNFLKNSKKFQKLPIVKISGRVCEEKTCPILIEDAHVKIYQNYSPHPIQNFKTGSEPFSLVIQKNQNYKIEISKENYVDYQGTLNPKTTDHVFILDKTQESVEIYGKFYTENNTKTISELQICLFNLSLKSKNCLVKHKNTDFLFNNVENGEYRIEAFNEDIQFTSEVIEINGKSLKLEYYLNNHSQNGIDIEGKVYRDFSRGETDPVSKVKVELFKSPDSTNALYITESDKTGTYKLKNIKEDGEYILKYSKQDYESFSQVFSFSPPKQPSIAPAYLTAGNSVPTTLLIIKDENSSAPINDAVVCAKPAPSYSYCEYYQLTGHPPLYWLGHALMILPRDQYKLEIYKPSYETIEIIIDKTKMTSDENNFLVLDNIKLKPKPRSHSYTISLQYFYTSFGYNGKDLSTHWVPLTPVALKSRACTNDPWVNCSPKIMPMRTMFSYSREPGSNIDLRNYDYEIKFKDGVSYKNYKSINIQDYKIEFKFYPDNFAEPTRKIDLIFKVKEKSSGNILLEDTKILEYQQFYDSIPEVP